MAEELAFHEPLGDRRTVQGDQRTIAARAVLVDGAGDELLAGAALSHDADVGVAGGDLLDPGDHMPERLGMPDDPAVGRTPSWGPPFRPAASARDAGLSAALQCAIQARRGRGPSQTLDTRQGLEMFEAGRGRLVDQDQPRLGAAQPLQVLGQLPCRERRREVHDDHVRLTPALERPMELVEGADEAGLPVALGEQALEPGYHLQRLVEDQELHEPVLRCRGSPGVSSADA